MNVDEEIKRLYGNLDNGCNICKDMKESLKKHYEGIINDKVST